MTVDKFAEALKMVGFTDGNLSAIDSIFNQMSVAEEEIQKGQWRWPKNRDMVWGVFSALMTTDPIREFPERLYRAHCAELIDRVGALGPVAKNKRIDLSLATDAELCGACSTASMKGSLSQEAQLTYVNAFERIFGEETLDMWAPQETWPGQAEEVEHKFKKKLAQEWRVLYWNEDMERWKCDLP